MLYGSSKFCTAGRWWQLELAAPIHSSDVPSPAVLLLPLPLLLPLLFPSTQLILPETKLAQERSAIACVSILSSHSWFVIVESIQMPGLRGVELSLKTQPSNELIPEYPHPEGASARLLDTHPSCRNGQASQCKVSPTVAVYIPSVPG